MTGNRNTRGERNNNPGNIRASGRDYPGELPVTDGFERFDSPENGFRAAALLLLRYQQEHGLNTIRGMVSRWAPPSENDTEAYIRYMTTNVSRITGRTIRADEPINLADPELMAAFLLVKSRMECGSDYFTAEQAREGANRALSMTDDPTFGRLVRTARGRAPSGTHYTQPDPNADRYRADADAYDRDREAVASGTADDDTRRRASEYQDMDAQLANFFVSLFTAIFSSLFGIRTTPADAATEHTTDRGAQLDVTAKFDADAIRYLSTDNVLTAQEARFFFADVTQATLSNIVLGPIDRDGNGRISGAELSVIDHDRNGRIDDADISRIRESLTAAGISLEGVTAPYLPPLPAATSTPTLPR